MGGVYVLVGGIHVEVYAEGCGLGEDVADL